MSLKSKAISGIKWTTVEKVGKAIFQLIQVAILTRFLPKEAFGLIAIGLVIIGFTNIFVDFGFTSAILYKQDATKKEYNSIYWLNIFTSVILYFIIIVLTPFITKFYQENQLAYIIPLLALNLLFNAIGRQHKTILQKEFRFKNIAITEIISYIIGMITAVVLAYLNYGVYSLVYSTLIASLVGNSLFLLINIRKNPILLHFKFTETITFLKVGGYQTGSRILDFLSKEADIIIIGRILGSEELGIYSLSKQIVIKVYSIINPIVVSVLSPLLSSIQNEKQRVKNAFLQVVKFLTYVNFPVYLMIMVGAFEIITILYGRQYSEGYLVLVFLSIYYCLNSISNPVSSLHISTGRTDVGFYWTILRVAIAPLFIFFGASSHGINGVAIALAILAFLLIIPIWYIQMKPLANISLTEYLNQFYKQLILLFIAGSIFYMLDLRFVINSNFLNLILKEIIVISFYLFGLYLYDKKNINRFIKYLKERQQKL